LRFASATTETDANGQVISSGYDDFGRLTTVVGPYQTGTGLATLRFDYHPEQAVPFARTEHIDVYRNVADPIETILFTDGLQRVLQTKQDATLFQGKTSPAVDIMTVSGCVAFDHLGRSFESFYPTTEPKGSGNLSFHTVCDPKAPPARIAFDVLGRPL